MLRTIFVAPTLAVALLLAPKPVAFAAEATGITPTHKIQPRWHRSSDWAPRQYWQWDAQPLWPEPWTLRPFYWESLNPPRVPANVWARKWHLPRYRCRRWSRPDWHCR
jgi:hypothetical protein